MGLWVLFISSSLRWDTAHLLQHATYTFTLEFHFLSNKVWISWIGAESLLLYAQPLKHPHTHCASARQQRCFARFGCNGWRSDSKGVSRVCSVDSQRSGFRFACSRSIPVGFLPQARWTGNCNAPTGVNVCFFPPSFHVLVWPVSACCPMRAGSRFRGPTYAADLDRNGQRGRADRRTDGRTNGRHAARPGHIRWH